MRPVTESAVQSPKSPKSPESEKSKRYDRQLRLWGDSGQQALESSHVCLVNANALGTEILKSLVLPGIRAFTIIDNNIVTEEDVGNNFFLLTEDSIGKNRGKVTTELLAQMNNDLKKGDYLDESLESVLESNANFFSNYSLVIACDINNEKSLNRLSQVLWQTNVPLIVCKSIGFIGYIRLQILEHTIIESHPDNTFEDLRLDEPFDQLKQYLDSYESFEQMSRKDLSHTPFLVILYKYLIKWRQDYNRDPKDLPKNFKEKNELKAIIRNAMDSLRDAIRSKSGDEDMKDLDLENFEESIKAINTVFVVSDYIPLEVKSLINDTKVLSDETNDSSFWALIKGLKQFIAKNNCLPLRGTLPDMTSDSFKYITLQQIYRAKAKEDAENVYNIIQMLPKAHNLNLTENDVQLFCKNTQFLRVVGTSDIESELNGKALKQIVNTIGIADEDTEDDALRYYLLMRLVDKFYSIHNRFPGDRNDEVESDIAILRQYLKDLSNDLGTNSLIKDDLIHEICRYGGSQLHTVSAFIAGCAAQEVIKILTSQYVPIDNTFVYNGMTCVTKTYKL
ncbi:NEDD8-activating enzyme E1 regulatory subunit-like [Oppia nitens]|uniref:NEDD8-activating enzyme E1 regulatory subunit-like n=1 Tax=Oppia nitens TaxID=1686743 RepID=UPI0023D9E907|nr:NEDD8-activating enzyme E1 regulatory subunit-like [Oppia nitens]